MAIIIIAFMAMTITSTILPTWPKSEKTEIGKKIKIEAAIFKAIEPNWKKLVTDTDTRFTVYSSTWI